MRLLTLAAVALLALAAPARCDALDDPAVTQAALNLSAVVQRLEALEKRVAELERDRYADANRPQPQQPQPAPYYPQPVAYQPAAFYGYQQAGFAYGEGGACAGGSCGAQRGRFEPFGGRFRRR